MDLTKVLGVKEYLALSQADRTKYDAIHNASTAYDVSSLKLNEIVELSLDEVEKIVDDCDFGGSSTLLVETPLSVGAASFTVVGDQVYLIGKQGYTNNGIPTKKVKPRLFIRAIVHQVDKSNNTWDSQSAEYVLLKSPKLCVAGAFSDGDTLKGKIGEASGIGFYAHATSRG